MVFGQIDLNTGGEWATPMRKLIPQVTGLAKIKSGELLGSFVQAKTSGLMGSPFYMAPEQWSDDEPDVRADIYSLGVILYQMLAGEVPFRGSSIPSIMKKHLTTEAPSFASFNLDVPASIESVVNHALAKEASHRPQSVEQLIHELRDAVSRPNAVARSSTLLSRVALFLPLGVTIRQLAFIVSHPVREFSSTMWPSA